MNCCELERIVTERSLSAALPLPAEAEEHLMTCSGCNRLVHAFRIAADTEPNPSPALTQLSARISENLQPIRPLASTGSLFMVFLGIFVLITGCGVYREGSFGLSAMSPLQSASMLCVLGACAAMLVWSLVHQMVPGSRHWFPPEILPAAVIGSLSFVAAFLFHFRDETRFWHRSWFCLQMGLVFALLAAGPFCMLLRRGAVLSPRSAGAAAGLLAGLTGMSILEIHCPNLDLRHILVSHVGVAIIGAVSGLAAGIAGELVGRYPRGRRHAL